jgi:hypothetical protein
MLLQNCRSSAKSRNFIRAAIQFNRNGARNTVCGSYMAVMRMTTKQSEQSKIYVGPLATVAKRLKIFSISSLGLSGAISPFVFILDFPVPVFAKVVLVGSGIFQ